ncbi:hypothetical protein KXX02_008804 [Aspergillus fumigatus]|nr:hypothetical protein KXX02_008804 [Aspergillus fumigatus]
MAPPRAPYIVPALKKHTATVIMAHGLGDSGAGWMSLAQNWRRRGMFDEVAFIFPNAPMIPITVNFGMTMPGWHDLTKLGRELDYESAIRHQDEPGVLRSRDYFNTLIKELLKNYIPENWPNKKTPFFLAHGLEDEIVLFDFGDLSAKKMKEIGLEDVTFKSYPNLGHSADPVEIEDLARFLQKVIPPEDDGQASAGL